ncbi:hypothetical protein V1524DRAFT_418722 [Lipomyces starkeyi]
MGITRKMEHSNHFDSTQIFGFHGLNVVEKSTSAIPDGGIYNDLNAANSDARLTVASILGWPLPSNDTMDLLLEEYFDSVHWFSLVIFEPRFLPEYESVADGAWDSSMRNAAVRISAVTKLPSITQMATDSHLVAFLAIVLGNAAIVMVVFAMSDSLSDRAQEAKRKVTRIFRVEETEAMLAPNAPSRNRMTSRSDEESDSKMSTSITVQGVLRDLLPERKVGNTSANSPTPLAIDEEAFILNESLVSMQKYFGLRTVLPGLGSCVPGTNDIESQERHQTSTRLRKLQPASKVNSKLNTTEQTGSGPIDYGCVDSGLYWIWDMNTDMTSIL